MSNDETWLKKYKHKTHNHNTKKEKINENNRYNNQTEDIKYNKDNANLESARIEFKKYITYYFLKKGQNQKLSKHKKEQHTKLQEKAEKLEEIDRKNEERRKELFKKMQKMDKIK